MSNKVPHIHLLQTTLSTSTKKKLYKSYLGLPIVYHFSFSHVKRLVLDTGFVQESLVALFQGPNLPSQLFVVVLDLVFAVLLRILNLQPCV